MVNKKIQDAINNQINAELYSAYLYLALAAHYEENNLKGFASWLQQQAAEEVEHAMKFYNFLFDVGGKPELKAINQPPATFPDPVKAFSLAYEHEQKVTGMIHDLYALAQNEKDYAFEQFLTWFIDEQVEEESSTLEIVEMLRQVGDNASALYMLDRQLASRGKEDK